MFWKNTETPTDAGAGGITPAVVETMQLLDRSGSVVATFTKDVAGVFNFAMAGKTGLRVAHAKYSFATDGGAISTITPTDSDMIPINAIIVGGTVNATTAVTSGGSATVGMGTSAGSTTTSLLAATAKASLSLNAVINAVPVFATPVKMTAAGQITFTVATAALTAGVIEAWVFYVVANA